MFWHVSATGGARCMRCVREVSFDVVVVHTAEWEMGAIEDIRQLRRAVPDTPLILIGEEAMETYSAAASDIRAYRVFSGDGLRGSDLRRCVERAV